MFSVISEVFIFDNFFSLGIVAWHVKQSILTAVCTWHVWQNCPSEFIGMALPFSS